MGLQPMRRSRMGYLSVDLEGEGSNCFSITQLVGQKKAIINSAKKNIYLRIKRNKQVYKTGDLRYSMTITNRPIVAQPIKMQDLHQSTSWVILNYNSAPLLVGPFSALKLIENEQIKTLTETIKKYLSANQNQRNKWMVLDIHYPIN